MNNFVWFVSLLLLGITFMVIAIKLDEIAHKIRDVDAWVLKNKLGNLNFYREKQRFAIKAGRGVLVFLCVVSLIGSLINLLIRLRVLT